MDVEVVPVDRSYLELVDGLTRLAEAVEKLEGSPATAMARLIESMASPRHLLTGDVKPEDLWVKD